MKFLDTLFGRTKPVQANLDSLFSLPSAAVTLESVAGMRPSGRAGVCFKPLAGEGFHEVEDEATSLGGSSSSGNGVDGNSGGEGSDGSDPGASSSKVSLHTVGDSYGYRWVVVDDADLEDLVTRVHMVNTTLAEAGYGPQLLCSVFGLANASSTHSATDIEESMSYIVYLYKRGTFYPFAPRPGQQRDNEMELRLKAVLGQDLKMEEDLDRWFPLWGLPVR